MLNPFYWILKHKIQGSRSLECSQQGGDQSSMRNSHIMDHLWHQITLNSSFKFNNERNVFNSFIKKYRVNFGHSKGQELRVECGIDREKPTPNQKKPPGNPQRNILENHKEITPKTKRSSGILHRGGSDLQHLGKFLFLWSFLKTSFKSLCDQM